MSYQLLLGSLYNGDWSAQDYSGLSDIAFVPVGVNSWFISIGSGNDQVVAFDGDGFADLGVGNDRFQGGHGTSNVIVGLGAGNDFAAVGGYEASVFGEEGQDRIYLTTAVYGAADGGAGNDVISAASGQNYLYGGAGADTVFGGSGGDEIDGGIGSDKLYAGAGDDTLYGSDGFDFMVGGTGNDIFHAGAGDSLHGGRGADVFSLREVYEGPMVEIHNLRSNDRIELAPGSDWAYNAWTHVIMVNGTPLIHLTGTSVVPTIHMFLID